MSTAWVQHAYQCRNNASCELQYGKTPLTSERFSRKSTLYPELQLAHKVSDPVITPCHPPHVTDPMSPIQCHPPSNVACPMPIRIPVTIIQALHSVTHMVICHMSSIWSVPTKSTQCH